MKIHSIAILAIVCQQSLGFQPLLTRPRVSSSLAAVSDTVARRSFLDSFVLTTSASLLFPTLSIADDAEEAAPAKSVDYKAVAEDIAALVKEVPDRGPTLVRLAWHSSGTYDKMLKDGGSAGGTIRFKEELAHGGNAGLAATAVEWMDPIQKKYADQGLSYADLYTLGGGECLCCA
jgi:catalase (peroxidase I)